MEEAYLGLRIPNTFAMYEAGTKCDLRLIKAIIQFRVDRRAIDHEGFLRNVSSWLVEDQGKERIITEFNTPLISGDCVAVHAEGAVAYQLEKLSNKKILQVLSERIP